MDESVETAKFSDSLRRDRGLVVSGALCVGVAYLMSLIAHWDVLPNWIPMPRQAIWGVVVCFFPYWIFPLVTVLMAFGYALGRLFTGKFRAAVLPTSVLFFVPASLYVLVAGIVDVERILLDYGILRYDRVIGAIEQYRADNGVYPQTLSELVPDYLDSRPGGFFKFGKQLDYAPTSESADSVPFKFELLGQFLDGDPWGSTLKYCPVEFRCPAGRRINDRWMWVSGLIVSGLIDGARRERLRCRFRLSACSGHAGVVQYQSPDL